MQQRKLNKSQPQYPPEHDEKINWSQNLSKEPRHEKNRRHVLIFAE